MLSYPCFLAIVIAASRRRDSESPHVRHTLAAVCRTKSKCPSDFSFLIFHFIIIFTPGKDVRNSSGSRVYSTACRNGHSCFSRSLNFMPTLMYFFFLLQNPATTYVRRVKPGCTRRGGWCNMFNILMALKYT